MNLSVLQEKTAWTLATWFGSGRSPKAPGTVGSLCSLPLVLIGYTGGAFVFFSNHFWIIFYWLVGYSFYFRKNEKTRSRFCCY